MASETSALSFKWTFIGIEEGKEVKVKRSSSEPPKKGLCLLDNSDLFESDKSYVEALWSRASKLQSATPTNSTTHDSTSDNESSIDTFDEKSDIKGATSRTREEEHNMKFLGITQCPASPDIHASTGFNMCMVSKQAPGKDQAMSRCNTGSIGHPEFCNRPCIFFPVGQCASSKDCNFCHGQHPHRLPHLDKINRTTFKLLSSEERRNLLLSALKERAANELTFEKQLSFFNLLREVFGSWSTDTTSTNQGWRDLRLLASLQRMPLISLYSFLQECTNVDAAMAREAMTRFRLA
jgi:hypothetical protein